MLGNSRESSLTGTTRTTTSPGPSLPLPSIANDLETFNEMKRVPRADEPHQNHENHVNHNSEKNDCNRRSSPFTPLTPDSDYMDGTLDLTLSALSITSKTDEEEKEIDEKIDITLPFLNATKYLELGELLHDRTFGLFEAMSAIEMMDPKMDAGMICNKGNRVIMDFDQSVEAGKIKLTDISCEELIGIIDATICCLVTWLEGHSLAQTVFTNLYLHKPSAIQDKFLRAFSLATLKQVDVIEECISKAGVFEEEDFQPSVYGYNLATHISDAKVSSMLRECEDDLQKRLKNGKTESVGEVEGLNALMARLRFTRVFHSLLLHLWKRDNIGECPKLISICSEAIATLQKTISLGVQRATVNDTGDFMIGFELLVNQRLLPPTFPRSSRIKFPDEAFQFIENLLGRMKTVLKITGLGNFHSVVEFFHSFSESRPCVLSRSLLQLLYGPIRFKKPGVDDMIESMKEAVKSFISPPVLTTKSIAIQNKDIADCIEMFFDRCASPFASLLMACGHNRARQRDKLAHLLDDFANLQQETERIDVYIHSLCLKMEGVHQHGNCFSNWLLYHISKVMIRYVLSGFELELYSVHELTYIYWYLNEFLYGWLLSSISRAETYMAELESSAIEKLGKRGAKNKIRGTNKKTKAFTKELCLIQAEQNLSGGYYKVMLGLMNDKRIPLPHEEFDNESVRYRHRFGAFGTIRHPSPVHYFQYREMVRENAGKSSADLYVASALSYQQAKQFLEAIPSPEKEINDLLKIAKTNFVVVKLLASGHTKESTVPPEFDFSLHLNFPIIKVK